MRKRVAIVAVFMVVISSSYFFDFDGGGERA